ncbi:MAG: ThiF family adenylyltransferase [Patescibacteria group bacterium]|nr:ThiF family adenylyltransferase [Patescibacteria group bacterium]
MDDYLRQLGFYDPRKDLNPKITIIGCGGIGSPTALMLANMGVKEITLMDFDTVEDHNRPNQGYRRKDIGKPKVEALKEIILEFAECRVTAINEKFVDQNLDGVVIMAVDTMEAREMIWEKVKWNPDVLLCIDGRLAGEYLEVFTIRPNRLEDIEYYEARLFSDEEAIELPCTAKGIIYIGGVIAAFIANQIKKWAKEERIIRKISFDPVVMTLLRNDVI